MRNLFFYAFKIQFNSINELILFIFFKFKQIEK